MPGAKQVPACNVEAPTGGDRGPRKCTRPPKHDGKHRYKEHADSNGRWMVPAPKAEGTP